jgi:hypothetical protein
MSWNNFEESLEFLHHSLHDSLNKLLQEAKSRNCISYPYGRPPTPSPFVNEDEIDLDELLNNPLDCEDTNDRASFQYDYGFNPLIFLSELILKSHPKSIAARQLERNRSVQRLITRVNHAKRQLSTARELTSRAHFLRSGVVHGPLTSPLTANSVLFWCRTAIAGKLILQIAKNNSFNPIYRTVVISTDGVDEPIKFILDDLEASSHYFMRCYLQELQDEEDEPDMAMTSQQSKGTLRPNSRQSPQQFHEDNDDSTVQTSPAPIDTRVYAKGQFWTLMPASQSNQRDSPVQQQQQQHRGGSNPLAYPLELLILSRYPSYQPPPPAPPAAAPPLTSLWDTQLEESERQLTAATQSPHENSRHSYGYGLLSRHSPHPLFTCYVGDILTPPLASSSVASSGVDVETSPQLYPIFNQDLLLSSATGQYPEPYNTLSPLLLGSVFLAWNDTSHASETSLKAEEVIYKQWNYEIRKHEKRCRERAEKEKTDPNKYSKRPLPPPPVLTRPPMTSAFSSIVKVQFLSPPLLCPPLLSLSLSLILSPLPSSLLFPP